jgi:dihydrofolate reductase
MSQVRVHNFSISLDGFGTGEGLTFDAPFGHAGHRLHEWVIATQFGRSIIMGQTGGSTGVDNAFAERLNVGFGAEIMGRAKFGPQTGPWTDVGTDDEWRGWWGPNPPFHTPVFVLTHHSRPSIEMEGGTVFHFVDASPQEALDLAREAAGDLDVRIGGGPTGRPRLPRCRPHRRPPRRAGADPARPRCSTVGRPRRHRGALQPRGSLVTERGYPPDLHTPMTDPADEPTTCP